MKRYILTQAITLSDKMCHYFTDEVDATLALLSMADTKNPASCSGISSQERKWRVKPGKFNLFIGLFSDIYGCFSITKIFNHFLSTSLK